MTVRNATRLLLAALTLAPGAASAQGTLADYQRASTVNQKFANLTTGLVQGSVAWIGNTNQAVYRVTVPGGSQFVLVDANTWTKKPAFDHARVAAALASVANAQYTGITLPFTSVTIVENGSAFEADAGQNRYRCTITGDSCTRIGEATQGPGAGPGRGGPGAGGGGPGGRGGPDEPPPTFVASPDGRTQAFIQNYNVAIRPAPPANGNGNGRGFGAGGGGGGGRGAQAAPTYTLLSTDGSEGDAYLLNSIRWSPDSKKLVAMRRKEGYQRIVNYVRSSPEDQVQPRYETTRTLGTNPNAIYQKPGDLMAVSRPVLFDIESKRQIVIDNALFPNAFRTGTPLWRRDNAAFEFEYNQRGHQVYRVLEVDANTGAVRPLVDETSKTFITYSAAGSTGLNDTGKTYSFDVGSNCRLQQCRTYGGGSGELIWMSERDGWNHLYLYDEGTGRVKNQITKGEYVVKTVESVDVANRHIYFTALGMNKDQDPYFLHYYRINFDGTGLVAYTEANGTHTITWSPDRQYYIDSYSRVDMPPVVELKRASDRKTLALEKGDMSAAIKAGFVPPEVFVAKGRDGVTDIWGIIVRPVTFDPKKKYPVIESIYAGPQGSFTPKSWTGGQGFLSQAELGFIVVQVDGMGTSNRSKAFHDVAFRNLADAGFPDRILWHQAINKKYAWYDITRVGIYGGSAGGQNAAGAVFFHPEFYDAAFASSGCHDNRMDKIWWNEQWMGEMGPHYEANSNVTAAKNLKGSLFLAVGELDTNVDPSSTLQVADALIRAGKDFELLVVPNGGHGATGPNGSRIRNDFFVRSLMGVTPPKWNSGITLAPPRALNPNTGQLEELDENVPPYGFFDDPEYSSPKYFWW
jgi:dipeptidyl aminopeptidase/acylaminoacyl peptidase